MKQKTIPINQAIWRLTDFEDLYACSNCSNTEIMTYKDMTRYYCSRCGYAMTNATELKEQLKRQHRDETMVERNNMKIISMPNYNNTTISFDITKGQIESLIEFIDLNFIPSIRNDEDIDNMDYICNICDIYRNLTKAQETIWDNEEKLYNNKVGEQNE